MKERRAKQPQKASSLTYASVQTALVQRHATNQTELCSVPPIVQEVLRSPGQPLNSATRMFMEPRFGHDFGRVRVHTDARAAESARAVSALAYTVGRDIVFDAGLYAPRTRTGHELLAHELAHVVQQGGTDVSRDAALSIGSPGDRAEHEAESAAGRAAQGTGTSVQSISTPAVQRREKPNKTPDTMLDTGDWTVSDRVYETARWQRANLINLINQRPHEYTQPHERRDFYLWVYNYTSGLGFETRWPLAAYIVASGAARLSYGTPFENDVQVAARRGNQIIFDDVFPKLRTLVTGPALRGKEAQQWDAQTLSEEQTLVQTMYTTTASETVDKFAGYARQRGFLASAGTLGGFTQPHRSGGFHRARDTPPFSGDIRSIDDRFNYGMRLADEFSTHPRPSSPIVRPDPGSQYTSGDVFRRLDTRMGLHRLDAELDDFNVDEPLVIEIMQGLSADEQRELGSNQLRLDELRSALNDSEMRRALSGLSNVPRYVRASLLGEMQLLFSDLPEALKPTHSSTQQ